MPPIDRLPGSNDPEPHAANPDYLCLGDRELKLQSETLGLCLGTGLTSLVKCLYMGLKIGYGW